MSRTQHRSPEPARKSKIVAPKRLAALALALSLPLTLHGCGGGDEPGSLTANGGRGGAGSGGSSSDAGAGVGKSCSASKACRQGLTCAAGFCAPSGATPRGGACVISNECASGACYKGSCAPSGTSESGVSCKDDLECATGLRCQLAGLVSVCQPAGVGDLGAGCQANTDCFGGLYCIDRSCAPASSTNPLGGTRFAGVECEKLASGSPRAYFEVPGAAGADEKDFFRLPFPNDARIGADGHLDISSFPTPGVGALGFDPVVRYLLAAQEEDRGWGTDPVVIFRFSDVIDQTTLESGDRLHFVDVTPDSDDYGKESLGSWYYSSERTPYVCDSWLAVRRAPGDPMTPGHTYAVYLTSGVASAGGDAIGASPNLLAVLSDVRPSDAALNAVRERYAPFREYLGAASISLLDVIAASVITVAPVREPMAALADAAAAAELPVAHDWVKCDTGVTSPCPDRDSARGRGCTAAADEYDEYQALVDLPIFQRGSAPYLTPDDGGEIDASGPVRTEAVCMSLTVPKGTMPDAGWPVIVFAHGTGGGYRDHVRAEVAGVLAAAPLPNGDTVPFAVLGIDQVEHGPRRGSSKQDPDGLFFNISNPAAARGNALQGAVDQLSLARFVASLDVTVESTPLKGDASKLFFFGHSQGSTEGSLMLPYSSLYGAAVLSGNGATLRESLLEKKSPVDIRAALPFVLSDTSVTGNDDVARSHPVLTLIQQWIDPADPVNFARALAVAPIDPYPARHVFQTYGLGDTYSPPGTLRAFAIAGGFGLVDTPGTKLDPIAGKTPLAPPLAGNVGGVTLGVREYAPLAGDDGHFVAFLVERANTDVARFFAMAASGETPAIGD